MKKNIFTVISVLFISAVIFISLQNRSASDAPAVDSSAMDELGEPVEEPEIEEFDAPPTDVFPGEPSQEAAGFLPTSMESMSAFEKYQTAFQDMSSCLNVELDPFSEDQQMNYLTFHDIIRRDFGEVVTANMEWNSIDIQTPSGELRRIYIEYGPSVDGPATRTLKYFKLTPDGAQIEIPLSEEHTYSPTDTLIASLEADGRPVGQSMARRIFHENGDDLVLVEKDGRVHSFELPREGATFACDNFDEPARMSCRCL